MPPYDARPSGAGAGDGREQHHQDAAPTRCVCLRPATGHVKCHLLDDSVVIAIGTCDKHAPQDEGQALALVRALLHGLGKVESEIIRRDAASRGGGHDY